MTKDEFLALHPEGSVKGIVDGNRVALTGNDFDAWANDAWATEITVPYPDDGLSYTWDEASQSWQEVTDGL